MLGPGFFCLCRLPGQVRRWSWHGSLAQVAPRHIGDFSKAMLFLARFGAEAFGQKFLSKAAQPSSTSDRLRIMST